jgi:predicted ATPase
MNQMDHLYVVTGGPGSGKSTLIEALAASGVPGISRAPRPVRIGDDRMTETTALHHAPFGQVPPLPPCPPVFSVTSVLNL